MTLSEFLETDERHFVALEYYWLILNRTYLVLLANQEIIGLKVGGAIAVEAGRDPLTRTITSNLAVKGDLKNPYSYIKSSYAAKYLDTPLNSADILSLDKSNFAVPYREIQQITFDPTSKWGMGVYPHTGKIYISTSAGKKIELIILGNQSIKQVYQRVVKAAKL